MNRSRKSLTLRSVCAAALLAVAAAPAMAQQNLDKLKQFKVATTDLNIPGERPVIEVRGKCAECQ